MLLRKNHYLLTGIFVLVATFGCNDLRNTAPGGRELPERTQLPDDHFPDLGDANTMTASENAFAAFPFPTGMLTSTVTGMQPSFTYIHLPTTAYDSIAANLIDQYRLVANVLIRQWAERNTGIVLDLRSNGENTRKADYLVNTGTRTFPVVVVWDNAAENRAARYFEVMATVPGASEPGEAHVSDRLLQLLPVQESNQREKLEDMKIGKYF